MKTNRILGMLMLLALVVATGSLEVPPATAQQRVCLRLVKIDTCADWPEDTYGCCSRQLNYSKQPDGSIIATDKKDPNWKWQIWPDKGQATLTNPKGSSQVTWTVPPQTWCSDQDETLAVSMAFARDIDVIVGAKYWTSPVEIFQSGPSLGDVTGCNPYGGCAAGSFSSGFSPSASGSVSGQRPKPVQERKWDIGIYMDCCGAISCFNVAYHYEPIPAGQEPPGGGVTPTSGGAGGAGGQPGGGGAGSCTVNTGTGIIINAVDNDPENKLWDCEARNTPFGVEGEDKVRCFTFRYQVPPGGITSAALHVVIRPIGYLQDTDCLALATGQPNPDCDWAKGKMSGCVVLHGGFRGDEKCLNLDLLNAGCDPSVKISPEVQQAVTAQLNTGVLHFMLQDDTIVDSAQLVLNGGPTTFPCGTSTQPVGTGGTGGAGGTGGTGGTGGAGGATNTTLPTPPYGQQEPSTNVPGMTLQAGQRQVVAGEVALVPVWLIKAQNVANLNFDVQYDAYVARPAGAIQRGSLMDNTMLSTNPNELGIVRVGFARTSGLSGSGSVVYIPFRAEGQPGDRTTLTLAVTTINDPSGGVPAIDRINGEILIVEPDGLVSGDCDGDGWLTESDALCALEISVKLRPVLTVLDLDRSGDVTSRDATLILLRALGRR